MGPASEVPTYAEEWAHAARPSRTAGRPRGPDRRRPAGDGVLRPAPGPGRTRPARGLRHLRAPGLVPRGGVQRGPHRRHQPGHLRVPLGTGHRRPALPGRRHPRPVRARPGHGAGGVRRQRRDRPRRRRGRLHPDAGRLPRHPHPQPRPRLGPRRRRGRHPLAQPARRRRIQVQPAARRARGLGRHLLDPGPGQRDHHGGTEGRTPSALRAGTRRAGHRPVRLPRRLRP